MLAIKLARFGKKHTPAYRMVVTQKTASPKGQYLEKIGIYQPMDNPHTLEIDTERAKYWLSVGAQPTDTVHNLMIEKGIIEGNKRKKGKITKKKRQADKDAAEKAAEEAEAKKEAEAAEAEAAAEKPAEDAAPTDEKAAGKTEEKPEKKKPESEDKADAKKEAEEKK